MKLYQQQRPLNTAVIERSECMSRLIGAIGAAELARTVALSTARGIDRRAVRNSAWAGDAAWPWQNAQMNEVLSARVKREINHLRSSCEMRLETTSLKRRLVERGISSYLSPKPIQ